MDFVNDIIVCDCDFYEQCFNIIDWIIILELLEQILVNRKVRMSSFLQDFLAA